MLIVVTVRVSLRPFFSFGSMGGIRQFENGTGVRLMRMTFYMALVCACLVLVNTNANAMEPSVLGLHLGITARTLRATLKAKSPQCREQSRETVFVVLPKRPILFDFTCGTPSSIPTAEFDTVKATLDGAPPTKVVRISLDVREPVGQSVTVANLVNTLRQEFGKEEYFNPELREMWWFFDGSGNPLGKSPVPTSDLSTAGSGACAPNSWGEKPWFKRNYDHDVSSARCGTVVLANWDPQLSPVENDKLSSEYRIYIASAPMAITFDRELRQYLKRAQKAFQAKRMKAASTRGVTH